MKHSICSSARTVLAANWAEGVASMAGQTVRYAYTRPSVPKYPHQWLWDSCFHSISLSRLRPERALREFDTLLQGARADGFLPHMLFWAGPRAWLDRLLARPWVSGKCSRLTQPPVTAIALEAIHRRVGDPGWLRERLSRVIRTFDWLAAHRDADGDGLLSIVHPWEAGTDASPAFDALLGIRRTRPSWPSVQWAFWRMLLLYQRWDWDDAHILRHSPFNVKSVLFNCIYADGLRAIARLSEFLGEEQQRVTYRGRADQVEAALVRLCWDQQADAFFDLALPGHVPLKAVTVASLFPLLLASVPREKVERLLRVHLLSPEAFWLPFPLPSVSMREPQFDARGQRLLWRGPTWINTNWFLVRGLRQHGYHEAADALVRRTVDLIQKSGYREYYNPLTGQGLGQRDFGWSTLVVDLLEQADACQAQPGAVSEYSVRA